MRVGVLRTQVPFVTGGAESHAQELVKALEQYGHEATEITTPFKWYPGEVLAQHILAARLLDLSEVEGVPIDTVIGLKFPAYLAPHPDKRFWILHQHRQAYDQWSLGTSDLLDDPDGEALRQLIMAEDQSAFAASQHPIFANSQNVANRLKTYLGVGSKPLYHPPPQADAFQPGSYGDYLFAPGRLNPSKRLELIFEAMTHTKSQHRLVIAGRPENPAYLQKLQNYATQLGIDRRIEWLGQVSRDTLLRTYSEARAIVFVPQDEDYGYITLEAMLAAKPVITVTDAGGPLEFIRHKRDGLITPPTPKALGKAFERVMRDRDFAERLGTSAHSHYQSFGMSWEHVVDQLIGTNPATAMPSVSETATNTDTNTVHEAVSDAPLDGDPMAQLSAAIAPPEPPEGFPFASIDEVLKAFEFEELPARMGQAAASVDAGLANYLGTHWTRFLTTLRLLDGTQPKRALDVGVFPPLVFQALLATRFPGIQMSGIWEGPQPYKQHIKARDPQFSGFDITLSPANSERDPWPYEDETFDLVTGMEILEHLALDPYWAFCEANRVLKPGGQLVLTTPNVTSHRGVSKVLNGIAPYSFGIFVPTGGVYGRHNREYAPAELQVLGNAAGFEVEQLFTADVYDRHIDPYAAELLVQKEDPLHLRGETIFYSARKCATPRGLPAHFYHGDPSRMSAAFGIGERDAATGVQHMHLENRSKHWWPCEGQGATALLAEWIDSTGTLRHQSIVQPFHSPIAPGETCPFLLSLDPQEGLSETFGVLQLHAFQIGVGVFTGTGRADPVMLSCSEEAYFDLVRSICLSEQGA